MNAPSVKRRYSRVLLEILDDQVKEIVGALAEWPGGQFLKVFDMSYSGVALENNPALEIFKGQKVMLHFHLGGCDDEEIESTVIWFNGQIIGMEFSEAGELVKERLVPFLQDKLLGLNLHLVPKEIAPPWSGFSRWYHGPKETNVYIWTNGEEVERALMTLEGEVLLIFEDRILQTVIEDSFDETNPAFDALWARAKPAQTLIMRRFTDILSQVQNDKEILQPLLLLIVAATQSPTPP